MTGFEPRTSGTEATALQTETQTLLICCYFTYWIKRGQEWAIKNNYLPLQSSKWNCTQCDQMGNLLDFGPLFKAFGNNLFAYISCTLRQFL